MRTPASEKASDRRAVQQPQLTLRRVFGQAVKSLRDQLRLTQRSLAERLGVSREQIVAIEAGRSGLSEKVLANLLAASGGRACL